MQLFMRLLAVVSSVAIFAMAMPLPDVEAAPPKLRFRINTNEVVNTPFADRLRSAYTQRLGDGERPRIEKETLVWPIW